RGGATVLMIAELERFLKDVFEEYVEAIAAKALVTTHPKLDASFVEFNDFNAINWIVRESRSSREAKVRELKRVASHLTAGKFLAESFNRTKANPGPETVKAMLREFGAAGGFAAIEARFGRHY